MRTDRVGPDVLNSQGWGDVWKARRLRRAAWQDSQSSRHRATHPAGLPDIMTTAVLNQRCLKDYGHRQGLLRGNPTEPETLLQRYEILEQFRPALDQVLLRTELHALRVQQIDQR
jgi:hypothetical protein